jgi:hypothetical protein
MFKIKLSEDARYGVMFLGTLLSLLLIMILMNFLLGGGKDGSFVEKDKEKTIIITESKPSAAPPKPLSKNVVGSVREAMKKVSPETAYLEIKKVQKGTPEYEELNKIIAEENQKRKAPGVRKEAGSSPSAPVRYLDESTPRDRTSDAIYIYFVDVSSALLPHFCIQSATKRPLKISGFTITADNKNFEIVSPAIKLENTEKGVTEWYDVPLDQRSYEAVQAMIKAKKSTLTITGSGGKTTRAVTDSEKKAFRQVLDGYAALGGTLNYLQAAKPAPARAEIKRQTK